MHIHGPGGWLLAIALLLYGVSEVQSTAVQVRVQYEAFCPTCQDFVTKQLKKLVEADGVLDIVDLKLYAWGNARRHKGKVYFQHGKQEGYANAIMNCAMSMHSRPKKYVPILRCLVDEWKPIQAPNMDDVHDSGKKCARKLGHSWDSLHACAKGAGGKALQDKAEDADPSDQNYTPWVLVDGDHSRAGEADIVDAICTQYLNNGGRKKNLPSGCPAQGDSGKVSAAEIARIEKDEMKAPKPCMQTLKWAPSQRARKRSVYQRRVRKVQRAVLKHVYNAAGNLEARAAVHSTNLVDGYDLKDHTNGYVPSPSHLPPGLVP